MAFGIPVITTRKGAEGLEECTGALIIKETPEEMALEIKKIMADPELRKHYSNTTQQFISAYNNRQKHKLLAVLS